MGELLPEIHDIGKLIDESLMRKGHNFLEINKEFKDSIIDNPCWKGIKYHHNKQKISQDIDLFLLNLADRRAASVSRIISKEEKKTIEDQINKEKKGKVKVYKLWNPEASLDFYPIADEDEFKDVIDYVNNYNCVKNNTQYLEDFRDKLLACPEDKFPGRDVTSLMSHEIIVGKFYRFFRKYKSEITDEKGNNLENIPKNAENNIRIKLVKGKIDFNSSPTRIKDLPIFEVLKDFMERIKNLDETIFHTSDEFLLILPITKDIADLIDIDKSLNIETEEATAILFEIFPTPEGIKRRKESSKTFRKKELFEYNRSILYGKEIGEEIPDSLGPRICEICQMAEGSKQITDEEGKISEILCDSCYNIRENYVSPLGNIEEEKWEKIMWIKVALDSEELVETLERLYKEYLKSLGVKGTKDSEIRFSILSDFYMDYKKFLGELNSDMKEKFGYDGSRVVLDDFFAVKIENPEVLRQFLSLYYNLFKTYFPELIKNSPIKLAINICGIKYPFFNIWRSLHSPENEIKIGHPTKGTMRLGLDQLDFLLDGQKGIFSIRSHALHKLAEIENVSQKLAWTEILQNRQEYDPLAVAVMTEKFKIKDILTYVKIMKDIGGSNGQDT